MCQSGAPSICPSGNLVWTDNKQKGHTGAGEQAREHGRRMTGQTRGTLLRDRCGERIWLGRSTGREAEHSEQRWAGNGKWRQDIRGHIYKIKQELNDQKPKHRLSIQCPPGSGDGGSRRPSPRLLVSLQMFIRNQWSRIHISSRSPLQWSSSQTVLNMKSAKQLSSAERINLSCPQWLIHFESASNRQVSAGYVVFLLPDAVSFYT